MGIKESFNELNRLGKAGTLVMAAGLLSIAAYMGIDTVEGVSVNDQHIEVADSITTGLALTGLAEVVGGQVLFFAGFKRRQG